MIIAISGSVGSGKSSVAKALGEKIGYEVVFLNDWAKEFKLRAVEDLETFDFDIAQLLVKVENYIDSHHDKNLIFEGHFAHFISPKYTDVLFVVNRDLKELKAVYEERGYNEQKMKDNLECESFNLCFYEAEEEGYNVGSQNPVGGSDGKNELLGVPKVFAVENAGALDELVGKIENKLNLN